MTDEVAHGEVRHAWLSDAGARMSVTEASSVEPVDPMLVLRVPIAGGKDATGQVIDSFEEDVQLDPGSVKNLWRLFGSWLESVGER